MSVKLFSVCKVLGSIPSKEREGRKEGGREKKGKCKRKIEKKYPFIP